jgi:site-specific recombinase XerD
LHSVPEFDELLAKLRRHTLITGKSESTLNNYARSLASMALHFQCSPIELDQEQVLDYLEFLKTQSNKPSLSHLKHIVYGLRMAYKVTNTPPRQVSLPSLRIPQKLPVVLSQQEVRQLLNAPPLLKHRLVLAMLYGCGLRQFELRNIKIQDVDLQRGMLHVRQGKGNKDRYVPLNKDLTRELSHYIEGEKPYRWLFNGKNNYGQLQQLSGTGIQWIINQAVKQTPIKKKVTSHSLRHTYATHLLEMGLDIIALKEALGHSNMRTTLTYLHIARQGRQRIFSPLDKLYEGDEQRHAASDSSYGCDDV